MLVGPPLGGLITGLETLCFDMKMCIEFYRAHVGCWGLGRGRGQVREIEIMSEFALASVDVLLIACVFLHFRRHQMLRKQRLRAS